MRRSSLSCLLFIALCVTAAQARDLSNAQTALPVANADHATVFAQWWERMMQPLRQDVAPTEGCIPSEVDAQGANPRTRGARRFEVDDCGVQEPQ